MLNEESRKDGRTQSDHRLVRDQGTQVGPAEKSKRGAMSRGGNAALKSHEVPGEKNEISSEGESDPNTIMEAIEGGKGQVTDDMNEEIPEDIEEYDTDNDESEIVLKLKDQFVLFAKFGDRSSDGSLIRLSQSDKWFRQVGDLP